MPSNIIPFPGSNHERQPKLTSLQHESNVKRWPIRHTGQMLGDRALWAAHRESVIPPAQPDYRAVAANVVSLATEHPAANAVTDTVQPQLGEQEAAATVPELDAIRKNISELYDQEAA